MNQSADLEITLQFVKRRIEEEATRSGEPLTDEQSFLLCHLPKDPGILQAGGGPEDPNVVLLPRDLAYERPCALAKSARKLDSGENPGFSTTWDFAAAVARLNGHPISWLLHWAGAKPPRPWWDRWVLILAGLLVILPVLLLPVFKQDEPSHSQWAIMGVVYLVSLLVLVWASKRIEGWQLKQEIERCRRAIPVLTR